ncbi:MAG TPA: hypothetical protein VFS22_06410, partial [Flavisolibacter sp.]|nr:hypothetical protein [Flavisolibacter sp.]
MPRKVLISLFCLFIAGFSIAQKPVKEQPAIDTSFTDYDALFSELDSFLDSLLAPRDFTLINLSATTGFFNYESSESNVLVPTRKMVYSPSISHFSKSGLGISAA